jgi:hypothetical protein
VNHRCREQRKARAHSFAPRRRKKRFRRGSDRSREVNSRSIRESRNTVGPATTIEERVVALRRGRGSLGKAPRVPPPEAAGPARKDVRSISQRSNARGRRRRGTTAGPTDGDDRPRPYLVDAGQMRATPRDCRRRRRRRGGRRGMRRGSSGRTLRLSSARLMDPAATSFAIPPASTEPTASLAPRTRPGRDRRGRATFGRATAARRAGRRAVLGTDEANPATASVLACDAGPAAALMKPVSAEPRGNHRRRPAPDASGRPRGLRGHGRRDEGRDQGRHQRCAYPPHDTIVSRSRHLVPTRCRGAGALRPELTRPARQWRGGRR